jgi:hypothetical protein
MKTWRHRLGSRVPRFFRGAEILVHSILSCCDIWQGWRGLRCREKIHGTLGLRFFGHLRKRRRRLRRRFHLGGDWAAHGFGVFGGE